MKSQQIFRKLLFIAGCAAVAFAANVTDSRAATANSTAGGIVVAPIGIAETVKLDFGKFMASAVAGTVVIDQADNQTVDGTGVTSTAGLAASAKSGQFTITGEPSATYVLSLPPSVSMTGPGTAIPVDNFTTSVATGTLGTLPAGGSQVLIIGAKASVNASQAPGTYSGALAVTVNYN